MNNEGRKYAKDGKNSLTVHDNVDKEDERESLAVYNAENRAVYCLSEIPGKENMKSLNPSDVSRRICQEDDHTDVDLLADDWNALNSDLLYESETFETNCRSWVQERYIDECYAQHDDMKLTTSGNNSEVNDLSYSRVNMTSLCVTKNKQDTIDESTAATVRRNLVTQSMVADSFLYDTREDSEGDLQTAVLRSAFTAQDTSVLPLAHYSATKKNLSTADEKFVTRALHAMARAEASEVLALGHALHLWSNILGMTQAAKRPSVARRHSSSYSLTNMKRLRHTKPLILLR